MSDDSLMVEGRKYLSSKRSAELLGYSSDYIGELCREGKVVSFRRGRARYVEENSLFRYLESAREKTAERKRELSLHLSRQLGKTSPSRAPLAARTSPRRLTRKIAEFFVSRRFARATFGSFFVFLLFFAQTPVARAGLEDFSLSSLLRITRSVTDELTLSFQETVRQTSASVAAAAADGIGAFGGISGSISAASEQVSGKFQDLSASAAPFVADLASFPGDVAASVKGSVATLTSSLQGAASSLTSAVGNRGEQVKKEATQALSVGDSLSAALEKGSSALTGAAEAWKAGARGLSDSASAAVVKTREAAAGVGESVGRFTRRVADTVAGTPGVVRNNLLAAIEYEDTFNLFRDTFDALVDRVAETLNRSATIGTSSLPNGSESASGGGATTVVQEPSTPTAPVSGAKTVTERIIERIIRVEVPVVQNITQAAPATTVTGGVSAAALDARLATLASELRLEISRVSGASSAQITTVFQTIGQATRIDQLANTTINTPSISGGTWSGASLTGTTNISSASISALTLSTATTTAENGFNISAGCFAVNGVCVGSGGSGDVGSGTVGQFPFYAGSGTALTATSSIYITQGGNIGIGTTSPSTQLGVQGSLMVSGTTTTGALTATGTVTFASGLGATSGGTGQTTFTTGDILYASGANTLAKLTAGSNGQVLKLAGGVPSWAADLTGGGGGGGGFFATTTNDMVIYPTDTADILVLGGNATTTTGNIFEVIGNTKLGGQLLVTSSTSLQNLTAANVTTTQATTTNLFSTTASSTNLFTSNFTLGRITGFLKATAGAVATALVDLAADVTGILPVGNGGTGVATLPVGSFLVGNGTSAVTSTSSPTVAYITATSTTATSTFAGAVNIGDQLPATAQSSSIFSVLSSLTKDPLVVFGSNSAVSSAVRIQNSAGNASLFVSSGANGFLTGTAAGDTGFRLSSNFHVGVTSALFSVSGSAGTVGIGSTTPFAKLAVNPVAGDANQFVVGSSTATSLLINNAGRVAVGTSNLYNSNAALHVTSVTKPHLILEDSGDNTAGFANNGSSGLVFGTQNGSFSFRTGITATGDFTSTGSERLTINSSGLVGIGSTTPFAKLAVNPVAGDANQFVVGSSTATSFLIDNAGRVGIGTTSPGQLLSISGASSPQIYIQDTSTGRAAYFGLQDTFNAVVNAVGGGAAVLKSNSTAYLTAGDSSGNSYFNQGNVGIGTTTPISTAELTITGTDAQLAFTRGAGSATSYIGTAGAFGNASTDDLRIRSDGSNILFGFSGTETIRFTSGGRAGFGTTTPFAKLSVHANNGETNTRLFDIASSTASATTSLFTVLNNGRVGIGAASPNGGLDVRTVGSAADVYITVGPTSDGSINNQQRIKSDGSGGSLRLISPAGIFLVANNESNNNKYAFSQSTTCENGSVTCFTSGGVVGIGSTSPYAKLSIHVNNGDTKTSLFNVASSTQSATTSLFDISNTGVITSTASATSTFSAGIQVTALNVTGATSTFANGIQLTAGCFRGSDGSCIGGGSSLTGTAGQVAYFSGSNTAVGTSSIFVHTNGFIGIATSSPQSRLTVNSVSNQIQLESASDARRLRFNWSPATGNLGQLNLDYVNSSDSTTSWVSFRDGNLGVGSTSPWARLAVNPIAGDTNQFVVGSSTVTSFIINPAGNVGIGRTTPATKLDVFEANASPQLRLSKSASLYSELTVDSTGDLTVSAAGGDIYAVTENLWICDGGSCPALTATSTAGNIFVENAVTFGNGFSFRQISVNELGLYNASSSLLMIFDQGN